MFSPISLGVLLYCSDADVASGSGEAVSPSVEVTTPASDVRSVERCVESRVVQEDGLTSMVRTLYFADTFLTNGLYLCLMCESQLQDFYGHWCGRISCLCLSLYRMV